MTLNSKGVLFIVTGHHYTAAAVEAAESIKRTNPTLKLGIFTDQNIVNPLFVFVGKIDGGGARRKHEFLGKSPFAQTLYLDSDIRVTGDLEDLFRILERYEIAGAYVRYRTLAKRLKSHSGDVPQAFPQINCGVMLYKKCERVDALFRAWIDLYSEGGFKRDQAPFREVLWKSDVRLYILAPEYNMRDIPIWPSKEPLPKILHIKSFHAKSAFVRWRLKILLLPIMWRLRRATKDVH
ncbi:MAG: hypothetical protein WCB71_02825 [Aestuariivirga sp.]